MDKRIKLGRIDVRIERDQEGLEEGRVMREGSKVRLNM